MKKKQYFIGVKFNKDKTLYQMVNDDKLNNSDVVRKALKQYYELNKPNNDENTSYNKGLTELLQNQSIQYKNHIEDLQREIEYFQHRLDYFMTIKTPIINRLFQKQITEKSMK